MLPEECRWSWVETKVRQYDMFENFDEAGGMTDGMLDIVQRIGALVWDPATQSLQKGSRWEFDIDRGIVRNRSVCLEFS